MSGKDIFEKYLYFDTVNRVELNTLPWIFQRYAMLVKEPDLPTALHASLEKAVALLSSVPEARGEHRYAPDKWSIKEVVCHIMDAERIFAYRALRFARNDGTELHGFEENDYAPRANAHARTLRQLTEEMKRLRATTADLYASFTDEMLQRKGTANGIETSVQMLGYILSGHMLHHCAVLEERYLKK